MSGCPKSCREGEALTGSCRGHRSTLGSVLALSDLETSALSGRIKPRMRLNQASDEGKVNQKIMKKLYVMMMALVAVFAFSAVVAGAASAETTLLAEWLINAAPVTELVSVETVGTIRLQDTSNGATVECPGSLIGSVGPSGEDEITELLNAAKGIVNLTTPDKECTSSAVCEKTTDIEVSATPPIHTLLVLMENGTILDLALNTGYTVVCLVLGIKITDTCTTKENSGAVVENVVGKNVTAKGAVEELGTCSVGGTGTGLIETLAGNETLPLISTNLLTVSSE